MVEVRRPHWQGSREYTPPGLPWKMGDGSSRWVELEEEIFSNGWYDPNSKQEYFRKQPPMTAVPFDDRNYMLFALLADVRNGRGFAGVYTHDPIEPLSEPRGIPSDASFGWLATVDRWDVDMHSHSYFTLSELEKYQQDGKLGAHIRRGGVITGFEYERIQREGGKPEGWCGSVSGGNIITITPEEYDAGVRAPAFSDAEIKQARKAYEAGAAKNGWTPEIQKRFDEYHSVEGRTYVQYAWEDELYENAGSVVADVITSLQRYAADLKPLRPGEEQSDEPGWYRNGPLNHSDIRVVFGFDN